MILINQLNKKGKFLRRLSSLSALVFLSTYINAQQIVFDVSKNQPVYLHDDGYAASSLLAKALDEKLYQVSVNQLPLDVFLKNNRPNILVLAPTVFQYHSEEEIFAVRNYVKKGGNLLIFAEHEKFFRSSENFNKFLDSSGIRINYDKVEQTQFNHFAEQFRIRAINPFVEKDSVVFFFPASLTLNDSGYSKAKTVDGRHLAAIASFGNGKIGVITDFEIIWNMTQKTGFQFGRNNEFILGIFNELNPNPGFTRATIENVLNPKKKNIWLDPTCIESDLNKLINYSPLINALKKQGYGMMYWDMRYDMPSSMKVTENDIYISLCACESKKEMNSILQFKRIFLAGYNKTDFWKNITEKFAYFRTGGYDTKHMEESLESLWKYDVYKPISWQDSLEIELGILISRKLSVNDSIFKTNVEIYSQGPGYENKEIFSTCNSSINLVETGYKFDYVSLHQAKTNGGSYYPAPFENNILLTTTNVPVNKEKAPLIIYINNIVYSTAPGLWRSDFPDKKFQQEAIKAVVEKLIK